MNLHTTQQLRYDIMSRPLKVLLTKQDLIKVIVAEVETEYGYSVDLSNRRKENILLVHLIYYIVRYKFPQYKITCEELSQVFNRSTSNIVLACKSIQNAIDTEHLFKEKVNNIKRHIQDSLDMRTSIIKTEFLTFHIHLN